MKDYFGTYCLITKSPDVIAEEVMVQGCQTRLCNNFGKVFSTPYCPECGQPTTRFSKPFMQPLDPRIVVADAFPDEAGDDPFHVGWVEKVPVIIGMTRELGGLHLGEIEAIVKAKELLPYLKVSHHPAWDQLTHALIDKGFEVTLCTGYAYFWD